MPEHFTPVPLDQCYRLMNHGPTVLVSARHDGLDNVMAAAWACVLDYGDAPKVTVVLLHKATRTRELVEASCRFALQLPCVAQARLTVAVGTHSAREMPDKLSRLEVPIFNAPGHELPMVQGCVGWLDCRLLPEPGLRPLHRPGGSGLGRRTGVPPGALAFR